MAGRDSEPNYFVEQTLIQITRKAGGRRRALITLMPSEETPAPDPQELLESIEAARRANATFDPIRRASRRKSG